MKLEKIRENVQRTFADGKEQERVDNVVYEIQTAEGTRLGECNIYNGGFNLSMNGATATIAEGVAKVKELFNITE